MRKMMILLGILMVSGCGVEGIHSANPRTVVRVNPLDRTVELYNNKDVDVQLEGLEVDVPNKVAKVEKLSITDNASKVREINPVQIDAVSRQSELIYNAWGQMFTTFANALTSLTLKVGGDNGWNSSPSTTGTTIDNVSAAVTKLTEQVAALAEKFAATQTTTTTQPASTETDTAAASLSTSVSAITEQIASIQTTNTETQAALASAIASVKELSEQVAAIASQLTATPSTDSETTTDGAATDAKQEDETDVAPAETQPG